MNQSINRTSLIILVLVTTLFSCNQSPTLQTYFVDNELKPGFSSLDVPKSLLDITNVELNEKQLKAYKSIDKLNVLLYSDSDIEVKNLKNEVSVLKQILSAEKYQELIRGGNTTDGKFMIKFLGDEDEIDEVVMFGYANDKGLAVVRVLGDDMNIGELMSLQSILKKSNFDGDQFSQISQFFKS